MSAPAGTLSGDPSFDPSYGGTLSGFEAPRMTLRPDPPRGTLSGTLSGATSGTLSGDLAAAAGTLSGDLTESEDAPAPEGVEVDDLEVERELGRGGMGIVYRATQRSLGRQVAVKVLRPDLARGPAAEKFAAEALATGRLEHPGIPPVHLFGRDARGRSFLAMKLVRGLAWSDLLDPRTDEARARARGLDLRDHLDILKRACEAVAYAHSRGLIHRDMKPENVMVGEHGEVLVMDWGIALERGAAARAGAAGDGPRRPVGTPAYMAPEMAACRDEEIGPATDVYLLGGCLYEVLTGTPPHQGESVFEVLIRAREGRVDPPRERAPERDIDPALAEIAMKALAPEPAARFQSPMDLVAALDEYWRQRNAMTLADFGEAEVAAAEAAIARGEGTPAELYGRFSGATAALGQAEELWPASERVKERLARARVAFGRYAIEKGDLALGEAQLDRAGPAAPGAAEARALLLAARARLEAEARRRRRLRLLLPAVLVVASVVGIFAYRAARRAEQLAAAEARRMQAEAELSNAAWGEWKARVEAAERAVAAAPGWAKGYGTLTRWLLEIETTPFSERSDVTELASAFERALWASERALELEPDTPHVLSDRGYAFAGRGEWSKGLASYARCAEVSPDSHEGLEGAGLIALHEGRFEEAEEKFARCIDLDPQQMDYFQRAVARFALGKLDGALEDALQVRGMQPYDEWYNAIVAAVYVARGDLREAAKPLVVGLRIHDEGPHLLSILAYRAALLGDRARAEGALAKARVAHRKYARAFLSLDPWFSAMVRAPGALGDIGRSFLLEIDLDRVVSKTPAPSLVLRRTAEERLARGDLAGALATAELAVADDPADGGAYLARGRALLALGHARAAAEDLRSAALFAPERAAEARALLPAEAEEDP